MKRPLVSRADLVELGALGAERLAARAGAQVLALDVVAGVALGVVVVDGLLDGVPRVRPHNPEQSFLVRSVSMRTEAATELRCRLDPRGAAPPDSWWGREAAAPPLAHAPRAITPLHSWRFRRSPLPGLIL